MSGIIKLIDGNGHGVTIQASAGAAPRTLNVDTDIVKSDGSVAMTGGLQTPDLTVGGNKVSGFTFKNKIINGNPIINQRVYVSGTVTTGANEYTLDRWRVVTLGEALTFATVENVTTLTLPAGGIEQVIEGLNLQSGTYTISFIATGDTVCEVDSVVKASGDTFTVTGGSNVTVKFSSALGTGTVKLIQVEEGSVATPFEIRDYGMELALCQRYYQILEYLYMNIVVDGNNTRSISLARTIEMRTTPTESGSVTTGAITFGNSTSRVIHIANATATAGVGSIVTNYIADAEL